MRRRLVLYFDRKNCLWPDDLADETLNRVARRLEEQGTTTDAPPARYCYIVAKFVFLEHLRQTREQRSVTAFSRAGHAVADGSTPSGPGSASDIKQKMIACLERCLEKLRSDDQEVIFEYYRGEQSVKIEHRRNLAARLGLTMNALSIRACRIRDKLELCVRTCSEG